MMREQLPEYIDSLTNKNKINYLFFTGDLRFAPDKSFPLGIEEYFTRICESANIEKDSFFSVIGNHDVNRENKSRLSAIDNLLKNYWINDSFIPQSEIKKLKNGRNKYYQILKQMVTDFQYKKHIDNSKIHFLIETDDLNIVHVDTTIVYKKEKENDLIIGTHELKSVLKDCNQKKPTIVISHYSPDSFEPNELKTVISLLKQYNVQLWFAGHKHIELVSKNYDNIYIVHSGNQTFERETSPGFVEGYLDTETGFGCFMVHKWNKNAGWALYQTLVDRKESVNHNQDRTRYLFCLDRWCKKNQIEIIKSTSDFDLIASYLVNYKGKTILVSTITRELLISKERVIEIFVELQQKGLIKPINYKKTHWEILNK